MMVRPSTVPNVAKAAVPVAMPRACARWVRIAELPAPSTAAMTSSGIAASVKPVVKWTAEASAKVAASVAIAIPVFLLGARRPLCSTCGAGVMVAPCGRALVCMCWLGAQPRAGLRGRHEHLPGRTRTGRAATPRDGPEVAGRWGLLFRRGGRLVCRGCQRLRGVDGRAGVGRAAEVRPWPGRVAAGLGARAGYWIGDAW